MANLVSHVWKPGKTRNITIDDFVPAPRGTTATAPAPLVWPPKDPGDILDYQLSIEPVLIGNEGDSIESVDIGIDPSQPGDLSADTVTADGHAVVIWMSGGQAGIGYNVTVKVALTSGRTVQRTILLPVIALSTPSLPANAIQTSIHDALTDQNGNVIAYN